MTRYASMFERCAAQERGAIVPFVMLGDPTPASCEAIIEALIADGADALELGIPFSDPVADGVVIQEAHLRALQAGTAIDECFRILSRIRNSHPDLPIREGHPFGEAALKSGIDSVYIAPPSASPRTLSDVAHSARGYVYAVSRVGVTGADHEASTVGLHEAVAKLREEAAAPVLLGFGISRPEHVRAALQAGADGAISGSAIVRIIAEHAAQIAEEEKNGSSDALNETLVRLGEFFAPMYQATLNHGNN